MKKIFLFILVLNSFIYAESSRENGVVIDSETKLEWQDDYRDNHSTIKSDTWENAIQYCESLNLNGDDWRLPNINELLSIVDYSASGATISSVFLNANTDTYWRSTSNVNGTLFAWKVMFADGWSDTFLKTTNYSVRCVRTAL